VPADSVSVEGAFLKDRNISLHPYVVEGVNPHQTSFIKFLIPFMKDRPS
jgi:hypothetical protein